MLGPWGEFLAWCESVGVTSLPDVQPLQVAGWIEIEGRQVSAPSVKQRLATLHLKIASDLVVAQPRHQRRILSYSAR